MQAMASIRILGTSTTPRLAFRFSEAFGRWPISTGKERDAESGNDYFMARYYASSMGRFLSPDWSAKAEPVPYAKLDNPQSLNLYTYALNNPLRNIDKDGHCDSSANATANTKCQDVSNLHANDAMKNKIK